MFDYNNSLLDQLDLTELQKKSLDAIREHGSSRIAAKEIGSNHNTLRRHLSCVRYKAAKQISPIHDSQLIPDGYQIKGVSNMVENSLGKPMWVKTEKTAIARYNDAEHAIEHLCKKLPVREVVKQDKSKKLSSKLLNQYTFTDFHIGMLAWHKEGGDNWNVEVAEKTLKQCLSDMIERSPKADTCVINQLGDFLHFDSMTPETPASGHILDADTRASKMVDVAVSCFDYLITECLRHHKNVKVIIATGNHDEYSSIWLNKMFSYMYRDNPRVEFIQSVLPFYALSWGVQMLGYHHGHKVKFASLPALFMDQFREMHGTTEKTAIHMGHYHHQEIKEFGKTVVEMHRTLAAKDAYSSYGGYFSERASDVITYHKDYGEVSRITVRPTMFGDC